MAPAGLTAGSLGFTPNPRRRRTELAKTTHTILLEENIQANGKPTKSKHVAATPFKYLNPKAKTSN